ncbi:trypsin-like serine protease [Aaosphaeria arxii CBS 175.79]|uniref:Trypsin-like serine protease n=1 Tax=Aaosphaeria arxii CBS 175.79 TaxID=1450172 RepID=A0A6A5XW05_9PLEO|nr:trypsin-like serine protease [Aaosphaeria arxii CBS 175.79]KAF2017159.1 trypsin-like serine protease [Aaosphaeria arxii CBS 175.79]
MATNITLPLRRSARHQKQRVEQNIEEDSENKIATNVSSASQSSTNSEEPFTTILRSNAIDVIPWKLPTQLPGLKGKARKLLDHKRQALTKRETGVHGLLSYCSPSSTSYSQLRLAVDATLIFAQEAAGTAVCISSSGLLLTCSHCVAETEDELDMEKVSWLIFASGRVVQAKPIKWDSKRDLALLQVVAAQSLNEESAQSTAEPNFPFISLTSIAPSLRARLLCIGHPGAEDLELAQKGVPTGYDVLHISEGRYRGIAKGQDVHDNSEIGALMHDCWTYWGHSGAPLVDEKRGELVGLHSSWDDQTGMRRGVAWEAIEAFWKGFIDEALSKNIIKPSTGGK